MDFFSCLRSLKVYWDMLELTILSQFFQIHSGFFQYYIQVFYF